jgi:HEAT repeats
MKTLKIALVSIVVLVFVTGLSNMALARTNVSIGVGVGYPGFYGAYGWGGGYRHFRGSSVIVGGYWVWPGYYPGYYYPYSDYYYPDYYPVSTPVVVERPPVVVERTAIVQPVQEGGYTESLYGPIGAKKTELLKVLMIGDKEHRINAINELAGYSFDDNVRLSLEKVLLSDTDPELRAAAANAFGSVRNPKAIPALEKARVEDSVTDVRKAADLSIKKLQGN